MATGTQVPWTTPGEPSCCCQSNCFTDLTQPDPIYSPDSYFNISNEAYAALYAGGEYRASIDIDIQSSRTSNLGVTTIGRNVGSAGNVLLHTNTNSDNPCYQQHAINIPINRFLNGVFELTWQGQFYFTRALATVGNQKKMSLASTRSSLNVGSVILLTAFTGDGVSTPSSVVMLSGNHKAQSSSGFCLSTSVASSRFENLPSTYTFDVNGTKYTPSNLFAAACWDVSSSAASDSIITGNVSCDVTFTPSAP